MSNSDNQVRISRRHLLKLIAAAGGGLSASLILPGKWVKPVMRTGVLPVHAQTSQVAPTATAVRIKYDIVDSLEADGYDETANMPYLDLSVTIQPANASAPAGNGIMMQAVLQPFDRNDAPLASPGAPLTASTTAGVASFTRINVRPFYDYQNVASIHITYSFATVTECNTTCTRPAVYLLPM